MPSNRGLAGSVLAIVAGLLIAGSTLLPWLTYHYELPAPGALTHHTSTQAGLDLDYGKAIMCLGLLGTLAGLMMLAPRARSAGDICAAGAIVAASALLADWWFRQPSMSTVGPGTPVAALGVVVGLVAVPLGSPGSAQRRLALLAGTVLGCVVATAIALLVAHDPYPLRVF